MVAVRRRAGLRGSNLDADTSNNLYTRVEQGNTYYWDPVSLTWVRATAASTNYGKTVISFPLAQGAAGTTQIAAASSANKHKIIAAVLTLSLDGTVKFTDGAGDLTGAMDVSAKGGLVIPASLIAMVETSTINTALSIVTTGGAAKGIIRLVTEP